MNRYGILKNGTLIGTINSPGVEDFDDLQIAEITTFGNGAHVVIPGKYLGKRIRYTVID